MTMISSFFKYSVISCGFVLQLVACSGKVGGNGIDIPFSKLVRNVAVSLTSEEGAPMCKFSVELDVAKGGAVADSVNSALAHLLWSYDKVSLEAAVDSFVAERSADYKEDCLAFYLADKKDDVMLESKYYSYSYSLSSETESKAEGVLTYRLVYERYEGGNNSVKTLSLLNFDAKTGHLYVLNDILCGRTERELEQKLLDALILETGMHDIHELRENNYLANGEIFVSRNFIVTDNSIIFVYNEGEIAAFDKGIITLEINK